MYQLRHPHIAFQRPLPPAIVPSIQLTSLAALERSPKAGIGMATALLTSLANCSVEPKGLGISEEKDGVVMLANGSGEVGFVRCAGCCCRLLLLSMLMFR